MQVGVITMKEDFLNFEKEKVKYIEIKKEEYIKKGFKEDEAINRANQSWRAYIGNKIQTILLKYLKESLEEKGIRITTDKALTKKNLSEELERVKRSLAINYGKYLFLPDADIVVYKINEQKNVNVIAIISVKNSFRERGFETAYWKLKLKESPITSKVKVLLATPDKDNEISFKNSTKGPRKMRIILEEELDGLYILKDNFESSDKVKHLQEIVNDIVNFCKEE